MAATKFVAAARPCFWARKGPSTIDGGKTNRRFHRDGAAAATPPISADSLRAARRATPPCRPSPSPCNAHAPYQRVPLDLTSVIRCRVAATGAPGERKRISAFDTCLNSTGGNPRVAPNSRAHVSVVRLVAD